MHYFLYQHTKSPARQPSCQSTLKPALSHQSKSSPSQSPSYKRVPQISFPQKPLQRTFKSHIKSSKSPKSFTLRFHFNPSSFISLSYLSSKPKIRVYLVLFHSRKYKPKSSSKNITSNKSCSTHKSTGAHNKFSKINRSRCFRDLFLEESNSSFLFSV